MFSTKQCLPHDIRGDLLDPNHRLHIYSWGLDKRLNTCRNLFEEETNLANLIGTLSPHQTALLKSRYFLDTELLKRMSKL